MPGTVTVACNMPRGLRIRLHERVTYQEAVQGGGMRDVSIASSVKWEQVLKGTTVPAGQNAPFLVGGYALTHGVDADAFGQWLKENKESPLVKNRVVFAHAKQEDAKAQARENEKMRTGLEPIDPTDLKKRLGPLPAHVSVGEGAAGV